MLLILTLDGKLSQESNIPRKMTTFVSYIGKDRVIFNTPQDFIQGHFNLKNFYYKKKDLEETLYWRSHLSCSWRITSDGTSAQPWLYTPHFQSHAITFQHHL